MDFTTNDNDDKSVIHQRKHGAANFFDYEDEQENSDIFPSAKITDESPSSSPLSVNKIDENKSIVSSTFKPQISSKKHSKDDEFVIEFNKNDIEERISKLIESNLKLSTISANVGKFTVNQTKLSTRQAVDKILSGENDQINLSVFKGKEQKLELLDYAILSGDKYTITLVIQFLEQTLRTSILLYELMRRPIAADHYLIYLRSSGRLDEQMNMLNMMGRYEDAAFLTYSRAANKSMNMDAQQQIRALERALSNFTAGGLESTQYHSLIKEHITLLEHQLPIESDDRRRCEDALRLQSNNNGKENEDNQVFIIHQPRPCLIGLTLMETLHYCHLYHNELPDNNFASPNHLKKIFQISDKQFLWIALQSFAKTMRWQEIDNLFEYKSWLGSRKIRRDIIPISEMVQVLFKYSAPHEMLEKYLDLVDDVDSRLQLAKEFQMNKYAADIFIKLRDRKRLSELLSSIQNKSEMEHVQRYIRNALNATTIKWRN